MARRRKKKLLANLLAPRLPRLNLEPDTKKSIFIVFIFALGAISFLSLFDLAGALGEYLLSGMTYVFGWGKIVFPLSLLVIGYFLYNEDKYEFRGAKVLGIFLFIISAEVFLHAFVGQAFWESSLETGEGGGYIGFFFLSTFYKIMGFWASMLIATCLLVISLMLAFDTTLLALFGQDSWFAKLLYPINFVFNKLLRKEEKEEEEEEQEEENEEESEEEEENEEENEEEEEKEDDEEEKESEDEDDDNNDDDEGDEEPARPAPKTFIVQKQPDVWWKPTGIKINLPLELLSPKKGKATSGDIKENTDIIQRSLENFGIPVEMGEISVGPTVTQYTFKPADGVKLSKITTLSNDLALALAAHPIRIEAPIPGKSLVGVEVPNQTKAMVGLREILSDKTYDERKSNLMIALGRDVSGKAWLYDVARMPHLLVAGATNSGKSVCLHSIILSLLYQNNPDDLKFIMVDPKRLELPVYNSIPYLLTPVITDVTKTVNALKWCLNEMDHRLDILSQKGKRNIQSYNETAKQKMPYIVFIIDELADLMMVSGKEVEAGIIRLAQLARAVGIHLILATQRPSVDVITGLIKANMPARIAFSVASGTDSRTILDSLGAEKLLGRGDMLFTTAEISKPKRIQGAFVSDLEIKKIVRYIKEHSGDFEYVEGITDKQKVGGLGGVGLGGEQASDGDDELLGEAKEIIINMGKASASLLQRRLSIGYARAARLLDLLEQMGVVGPANGAKPREILITKEQYEAMAEQTVSGVSLHNRDEMEAPDEFLPGEDEEESEEEEEDEEGEQDDEEESDDSSEDDDSDGDEEDEGSSRDDEEGSGDEEDEDENDDPDDDDSKDEESDEDNENEKEKIEDKPETKTDKNVKRLIDEKPGGFDKFFSR